MKSKLTEVGVLERAAYAKNARVPARVGHGLRCWGGRREWRGGIVDKERRKKKRKSKRDGIYLGAEPNLEI